MADLFRTMETNKVSREATGTCSVGGVEVGGHVDLDL